MEIKYKMRIPKRYGQSKSELCPFCGKNGVTQNSQGISVCTNHKNDKLFDVKCLCGEWLDVKKGKWGPYFNCMKCGNINFKKGMEMNQNKKISSPVKEDSFKKEKDSERKISQKESYKKETQRKEITITSDELDL